MPIRLTFSEGSGLNDSVYGKCQAPIRMFLEKRGEAFEQESVVERLFLPRHSRLPCSSFLRACQKLCPGCLHHIDI